ncbi:MAG: toll/interleukin-1 receptor domain-containing protein [Zoogloeaceae bacterium]|uniref:toll/interleukin-1 receptor domain-containing protein n=1 Tax=Denitromonas sp. TaxID=2734609 RepID=UPI001DBFF7F6|nr:toll/interleukin-1 receptor domain-containing protein [Rhodocyclaceae bacterium]MCP5221529.1 toll/interleukin-1 receptor domain-containing protein [Zoogloeaceae bacterium]
MALESMSQIFISYRREDSAGHAGRLEEALERHFGAHSVFRDVEDLPPGQPFPAALEARLHSADLALVLIGPRWLTAERDGVQRLSLSDDYVRMEVSRALGRGIPVVPVLLDDAVLPAEDELPADLRPLVQRHAVRVSDAGWADDVARLIAALTAELGEQRRPPSMHRRAALAGVAVVLAGGAWWWLGPKTPPFPAGVWQAEVRYHWGDTYQERFEFELAGNAVLGSASFLGRAHALEETDWRDGQLIFVTHSESTMGSETRTSTHRYFITREGEQLKVRYSTAGGFESPPPMVFLASPAS